jgi:hypothetical protein
MGAAGVFVEVLGAADSSVRGAVVRGGRAEVDIPAGGGVITCILSFPNHSLPLSKTSSMMLCISRSPASSTD